MNNEYLDRYNFMLSECHEMHCKLEAFKRVLADRESLIAELQSVIKELEKELWESHEELEYYYARERGY